MDLRQVVAANIRAERARHGLRQEDVAATAGLARSTLADVEAGRRRLYLDELPGLLDALGIGLSDLLAGDDAEAKRARRVLGA